METKKSNDQPRSYKGKSTKGTGGKFSNTKGAKAKTASTQTTASKNKRPQQGLNYTNKEKMNKNFMYKDLKRSNCYDCDFSGSNFDFTSFRGAHFKSCNFYGGSFKAAEFVGSNLKKSRFKKAKFEDVVFEGVNLDGVDFEGASFKNTIFVGSDVEKAKDFNRHNVNIKIYQEMPELEASEALVQALQKAMTNKHIKASRVLDTKDGTINTISVMRMRNYFSEEILVEGLNHIAEIVDKDFCTLSYIMKMLADFEVDQQK